MAEQSLSAVHGPVLSPRTGSVVRCPITENDFRVVGPADEMYPGEFKSPTNIKKGTRLWVVCGFELHDQPTMKTTDQLRKFTLIEPGYRR